MSEIYPNGPRTDLANSVPVGLAELPAGIMFHCPACEYIANGICKNPDPRIHNRPVTSEMCCNFFDHSSMKRIV